ncbi:MAG: hypothetical protein Q7S06_00475 [Nanoarchaeota archaeon]|nr:hypothetical protein [Nanoarchaeota archaeon]
MIKIIMIDAFKEEYLNYAPYLSSLTKKYQWGELKMPIGHWGGVEVFFHGKSDKLALFQKKEKSSLKWTKKFAWLEKLFGRTAIDALINFPRFILGYELFKTGKVPINQLGKFDFCVKEPLYSSKEIEFEYIGDLDNVAHRYGTKSQRTIDTIKKVDEKISKEDFDIIFSDHGMIDVKKTINVPLSENCFIDSDMARYWGNEEELNEIKKRLPMKDGKIIDWKDKSYGDLIFIVKPGILILPNYWQGKQPAKAMHGYYGDNKELNGIYIIKKQGNRKNLGVEELHEILNKMKEEEKIGRK